MGAWAAVYDTHHSFSFSLFRQNWAIHACAPAGDVAPPDSTVSRFIRRVDELWNGNICLLRYQAQGYSLASVNARALFVDKTGIEAQDMGATLLAQPSLFRLKFAFFSDQATQRQHDTIC